MRHYRLTAAAEADLRGIIRHTRRQWGDEQVRQYISALERGIAGLVAGNVGVKDLGEVFPGLRVARCEHHYVFCLLREDAPALVVAILHERMDLMARLADRLKP